MIFYLLVNVSSMLTDQTNQTTVPVSNSFGNYSLLSIIKINLTILEYLWPMYSFSSIKLTLKQNKILDKYTSKHFIDIKMNTILNYTIMWVRF